MCALLGALGPAMNADAARLLAQLCHQCGIHPQLIIPNENNTSVTTQVSLPIQASAQRPPTVLSSPATETARIIPAPSGSQGSHVTNSKCTSVDLAIEVINPKCKQEIKTYILHSISVRISQH